MSERAHNNYPGKHDTQKPIDRLFIASERVLNEHGKRQESKSGNEVTVAQWDSEKYRLSFRLQQQTSPLPANPTSYYFDIYTLYSDVDPNMQYYYDELDRCLMAKDEKWRSVKGEAATITLIGLIEYLNDATTLTTEERDVFIKIMIDNDMREPGRIANARYFAANIFKFHRKK